MQTEGYMIVLKPGPLVDQYTQSDFAKRSEAPLRELREAFSMFDVKRYRGISRCRLAPYPSLDKETINAFEATGIDMKVDAKALLPDHREYAR